MLRTKLIAGFAGLAIAGLSMAAVPTTAEAHGWHGKKFIHFNFGHKHKVCGYVFKYGHPIYTCWWTY